MDTIIKPIIKSIGKYIIIPILGAMGISLWTWFNNLNALAMNQDKYEEAYVQTQATMDRVTDFIQEQRIANNSYKEDQDRQWQVIMKLLETIRNE